MKIHPFCKTKKISKDLVEICAISIILAQLILVPCPRVNASTQQPYWNSKYWTQDYFNGGSSQEIHMINWDGNDHWNKYSSMTNLRSIHWGDSTDYVLDTIDDSQNGEIVSSIFTTCGYGFVSAFANPGIANESSYQIRFGPTAQSLSGWTSHAAYGDVSDSRQKKYVQFKIIFAPVSNTAYDASIGFTRILDGRQVFGTVMDKQTNLGIDGAKVKLGSKETTTTNSSVQYGWGYFSLQFDYDVTNTEMEISKDGYKTLKTNFENTCTGYNMSIRIEKGSGVSTTPASTTTESTAPITSSKPTLSLTTTSRIGINNQSSILDVTKPVSIFPTQKLTYVGATSANAKVALTIKSEPITKEVTADKDGKWTFTLDPKALKLAYGAHTVSAIATDTDGIKSDTVEIAKFELKKPIVTAKVEPYKFKAKDLLTPMNYILFGLIILLGGFLTFLILKRKKLRHLNLNPKLNVHIKKQN